MIKIAMIGAKGIPTLYGGVERHVEEVSRCMARRKGYDVYVYARAYYTPKTTTKYGNVNIIHVPLLRTKHLDAISHAFFSSLHAIYGLKADVIHYHAIGPAFCLLIPKILNPKIKVVFTFHCRDYFHKKWNWFARFSLRLGEAIACHFADEIIAVSPELKQYVKKVYSRPAEYIPHGVSRARNMAPRAIKKWGLKRNGYILLVSRLIRHKGVHYLIKAYQKIRTDKKLVIVGPSFYSGNYEAELKKLAGDNSDILFLGAQKGRALKELYSNAYAFVSPSEFEGFPLVVMEAASFGKPLLLSSIRSHRDMFGDLPYFFRTRSIEDLKAKLRWALRNSAAIHNRAKKIRDYSREKYNWRRVVDEIVLKYA